MVNTDCLYPYNVKLTSADGLDQRERFGIGFYLYLYYIPTHNKSAKTMTKIGVWFSVMLANFIEPLTKMIKLI